MSEEKGMYLVFLREGRADIKGLISFSLTLNLSLFNSIGFARWCLVCAALILGKPGWSWRCAPCATSTRIYGALCHQNGARPDAVVKHCAAHCTLVFWCFRCIRLCNIAHFHVASSFLLEIKVHPVVGCPFPYCLMCRIKCNHVYFLVSLLSLPLSSPFPSLPPGGVFSPHVCLQNRILLLSKHE